MALYLSVENALVPVFRLAQGEAVVIKAPVDQHEQLRAAMPEGIPVVIIPADLPATQVPADQIQQPVTQPQRQVQPQVYPQPQTPVVTQPTPEHWEPVPTTGIPPGTSLQKRAGVIEEQRRAAGQDPGIPPHRQPPPPITSQPNAVGF